jgi:hypothetical protein
VWLVLNVRILEHHKFTAKQNTFRCYSLFMWLCVQKDLTKGRLGGASLVPVQKFPSTYWIERLGSGPWGKNPCSVFSWKWSTEVFVWVSCVAWPARLNRHTIFTKVGVVDMLDCTHVVVSTAPNVSTERWAETDLESWNLTVDCWIKHRCGFFPACRTQTPDLQR